jgi:hypothetical protein
MIASMVMGKPLLQLSRLLLLLPCLVWLVSTSGCLEGKHRPFASETFGEPSDAPLSSAAESPTPQTVPEPNSGESLPAIGGIERSDDTLNGAAVSCGLDSAECLPAGDAGVDLACTPTGPRDCSSDLDNDCDGQADNVVDDVCACVPGSVQTCEEHPGLDGRGPCRAGLQTCLLEEATLTSGWGACEGSVGPGEQDSCTIKGDDTDCNGAPNSGCSCVDGATQDCGPNNTNGICRNGTSTCANGAFEQCVGAVFPAARDSCGTRGDDSNCNGIPSEGCICINGDPQPCGPDTDTGNCQRGTRTCVDGAFGPCLGAIFAAPRDSCATSGDDANCNGVPNDGCECIGSVTRACGPNTDVGNCQRGMQSCNNGTFGPCLGAVYPAQSDSCTTDGDDANCNGVANDGCGCIEGATRACGPTTDAGICQRGTQTCVAGNFGTCVGAAYAAGRNCGSQQDNDCDGRPDNTIDGICTCAIGQTRACSTHPQDGVGSCRAGQQQCAAGPNNASSNFGGCTGSVGPAQADSCTAGGNDANCDGTANGGCQCIGSVTQPCGTDVGNCQLGTKSCANGVFGPCVGGVSARASDSCDVVGDDANCNGRANDNCGECVNGQTQVCGPGNVGICRSGTQTCANGRYGQCVGQVTARARSCSSPMDNDCDGRADNTIDGICTCAVGATGACNQHLGRDGFGPCRAGQHTCVASTDGSSSRFNTCTGEVAPTAADTCTPPAGIDSDCDGSIECDCFVGQGNGACSDTPNTSRCNTQGQCVPCTSNDECAGVSGRRNTCVLGECVLKPTPSQCMSSAECASGFCVDGVCCAERCNGDCESCNLPGLAGQCSADQPGTPCATNVSEHFICDGAARGNDHCRNPIVSCGGESCPINNTATCCYAGDTGAVAPFCVSRADCAQFGSPNDFESVVDCDSVADCQTGEVCCFVSAATSAIVCALPAQCVPSPVSSAFPICATPGRPAGIDQTRFPGFTCR